MKTPVSPPAVLYIGYQKAHVAPGVRRMAKSSVHQTNFLLVGYPIIAPELERDVTVLFPRK